MSVLRDGILGRCSQPTCDKIKKDFLVLQQNKISKVDKFRMSLYSLT